MRAVSSLLWVTVASTRTLAALTARVISEASVLERMLEARRLLYMNCKTGEKSATDPLKTTAYVRSYW